MITASLGKGPWGREAARAAAAKNGSPKIPDASAAGTPTPSCRNDLREAALPLHRASRSIVCLQISFRTAPLRKNASGKRLALAGSIISEITELEDDLQPQLHVERFTR